ncbi:MAG: hypothetical protein N3A68_00715 [Bacteroidia bacterium]|jgi:hypothetical protein|nr:hypothetical protein [Bacteroidia bacterium]GIV23604.1 MAG: hypothetical protein KatS3mg025_1263 [Bacteroidia bacterium]
MLKWPLTFLLITGGLWAQTGGYNPNEIIGEDEEPSSAPVQVIPREEALIRINGEVFQWQDPLIVPAGKTYNIHITGLKPQSKLIIRLFKAGQKAGATHFDANESGEIELEVSLDKRRFQGVAEVIYYPSNGKEIRRRFKVQVR